MRILKNLLFAVLALMLVTSCSKVEDKIESQIPADAMMVLKANVPQLVSNLGITVKDGKIVLPEKCAAMMQQMGMSAEEFDAEGAKLLNSGIDLEHSIYCFVPRNQSADLNNASFIALIPVSDDAKLKSFLGDEMGLKLEDKDGMQFASQSGIATAVKDGVLYIVGGDAAKDGAACISALGKLDKNMKDNAAIQKAIDTADDVNVYLDAKQYKEIAKQVVGKAGGEQALGAGMILDMIDTNSTAYHLSLAGGELNVKCVNDMDDNSQFLKLINTVTAAPSDELLAFMPKAANTALFNVCLNGDGIANLDIVKPLIAQYGEDPQFQQVIDILKSINGPVAIGVASDALGMEDVAGTVAFKCGKAADLMAMLKEMSPAGAEAQGDEIVQKGLFNGMDGVIGSKGDVVYFKFAQKNYADNATALAEAKNLIGKSKAAMFISMNLDNVQLEFTAGGADAREGDMKFWVKQDGKNLGLLEVIPVVYQLMQQKGLM